MGCCGEKRAQFQAQRTPDERIAAPPGRPFPPSAMPVKVIFEYNGRVPLIVIGPVSGKRYRFEGTGARVEVNPRDRRSLAATPRLQQVSY